MERDWPGDFSYENGNYVCQCLACGNDFRGYKRRVVCRVCAQSDVENGDEIVGHKTLSDGQGGFHHEPLTRAEAEAIFAVADAEKAKREADMPDEQSALRALGQAYHRLTELGWRQAMYCPKDGTEFHAIEAGSTGIHDCYYEGKWPTGHYWIPADGDVWPSNPILFKPKS